jgi:predicted  nucleic acid-binding Zn-ribbon protein
MYPDAAPELLAGCKCGSKFFYYIKEERFNELNKINNSEIQETLFELNRADKTQIEKDIREITGLSEEPDKPIVLNLESVRVIRPGKFEIDIINLFSKKRPLIYRLEEGKYIIDLSDTIKVSKEEIDKKIRDPSTDDKEEESEEKKETDECEPEEED